MRSRGWSLLAVVTAGALVAFGCGGGGGGGGGSKPRSGGALTSVKANSCTVNLRGGQATDGTGGDGQYLEVYNYGSRGIQIGGSGTIDTSFQYPADPPVNFGSEPLVVNASSPQLTAMVMTIDTYDTQALGRAAVTDGEYFLYRTNSTIWKRTGAATQVAVTGIDIKAGYTLVLGLNQNWFETGTYTGQDTCYINVSGSGDVRIAGTLKIKDLTTGNVGGLIVHNRMGGAPTARDKGILDIECNRFLITSTGKIDNSGGNATVVGDRGGVGGAVWIYGYRGLFVHGPIIASGGNGLTTGVGGSASTYQNNSVDGIYLFSGGSVVSTAALTASGGNGSTGGDAGYVMLDSDDGSVYNTQALTSNGGTGTTGAGGHSYAIYLYADYGSINNSGKLVCNGGNSTDGNGGGCVDGVYIEAGDGGYIGQVLNSGAIECKGGNSTNANGGDAGEVYFETYGGDVRSTGSITACGGNGGTGAGDTGGDGYGIYIYTYNGDDYEYGTEVIAGDVLVSGNWNFKGGDAYNGGDAGDLYIFAAYDGGSSYADTTTGVFMYGYSRIDSSGGDGADGGSVGTTSYIQTYSAYTEDEYLPVGPIVINCDIIQNGGEGTDGYGGDGGYIYIETYYDDDWFDANSKVVINGDISTRGGDGTAGGGDSEDIWIYGYASVVMNGTLNARGGDGTDPALDADGGSYCCGIGVYSAGNITINGNIIGRGGDATGSGTGGDGNDEIELYAGGTARVNGRIDGRGGNGDVTDSGSAGGDGAYVYLLSQKGLSVVTGDVDISGGTAFPGNEGTDGEFWLDWVQYLP